MNKEEREREREGAWVGYICMHGERVVYSHWWMSSIYITTYIDCNCR